MHDQYFFNFDKIGYVKGQKPKSCILCLIRDRSLEIADLTVFRDELFIVSVNLYPYNPGHLLVFPSRHIEDIREYTTTEELELSQLTRYLLDVLDISHQPHGYNIGYNMGRPAGASISHLHEHIIPRYPAETGIADLIAGKRVLVEDPRVTARRLRRKMSQFSFSIASS